MYLSMGVTVFVNGSDTLGFVHFAPYLSSCLSLCQSRTSSKDIRQHLMGAARGECDVKTGPAQAVL
jgi:hypothetical protein